MHTIAYKIVAGRVIINLPGKHTVTDVHTLLQGLQPYNALGGACSGSAQFLHYNLNPSQGFTSNLHVTSNQLLSHYHTAPTPHTHILPATHLAKLIFHWPLLPYLTPTPHSHTSLPHLTPTPHSHTSLHMTYQPHTLPHSHISLALTPTPHCYISPSLRMTPPPFALTSPAPQQCQEYWSVS